MDCTESKVLWNELSQQTSPVVGFSSYGTQPLSCVKSWT